MPGFRLWDEPAFGQEPLGFGGAEIKYAGYIRKQERAGPFKSWEAKRLPEAGCKIEDSGPER